MTELTPEETENPLGGYGKTVSHVVIGLKTTKGTKQLKLDPMIYDQIQKEKVQVGDVIFIEASSGAVKVSVVVVGFLIVVLAYLSNDLLFSNFSVLVVRMHMLLNLI